MQNTRSTFTRRLTWLLFGLAVVFTGCNSTPEQSISCQSEPTESCEEAGDDRGYDPCRVNKNLPVCKK